MLDVAKGMVTRNKSSKPSPDPPFLFAFLPLSLSPLVVEASPPFPCSCSPKTVPKKIDIGGAPEEIFLMVTCM